MAAGGSFRIYLQLILSERRQKVSPDQDASTLTRAADANTAADDDGKMFRIVRRFGRAVRPMRSDIPGNRKQKVVGQWADGLVYATWMQLISFDNRSVSSRGDILVCKCKNMFPRTSSGAESRGELFSAVAMMSFCGSDYTSLIIRRVH